MHPPDDQSSPPLLYQWQEGAEDLEMYTPGGYHPTHLGDRFYEGRYEIVHKLEFGSYSTVWLAKDHQKIRFVALKIIAAFASQESREVQVLRSLMSDEQGHPGRRCVTTFLGEFTITGPNGRHQCIVSEVVGCNAANSKDETMPWKFPSHEYSEGNICVNLHSGNILFRLPDYNSCSIADIYSRFREPSRLPVQRLDGKPIGPEAPRYCVPPARTFQACGEIEDNAQVVIADFGEAFCAEAPMPNHQLHTPVLLLPPESIFSESLGPAIDVWTLGCTLYHLLGERHLFEGFMPDEDHTVAEMEKKTDFFLEDGSWRTDTHRAHAPWSRSLRERLKLMGREGEFGSDEVACFEKLLRAMLPYEPSERITAGDAVRSEWMQRWGLGAKSQAE
ncbi:kinase-like protein [Aspergillus lucknowensis]|uniref:non-specific serine/threonine protein kinase n=1 Tax=Aspergillus lucknowensis TaxID=176173 RepID=A0ABR4LYW3_9EURO